MFWVANSSFFFSFALHLQFWGDLRYIIGDWLFSVFEAFDLVVFGVFAVHTAFCFFIRLSARGMAVACHSFNAPYFFFIFPFLLLPISRPFNFYTNEARLG